MLRPESAPLWVHWLEMYVPLPYGNFPSRLLSELPHSAYRWVAWGLAILLCGMGYTALRGAMELAQPPGLAKRQRTPFTGA